MHKFFSSHKTPKILSITLGIIFSFFLAFQPNGNASAQSKIHYISVGNADAILIESADADGNKHYGLIDAANPSQKDAIKNSVVDEATTVDAVVQRLKELGVKSLDFVIATHNHSDHIGGIPAIAREFVNSNTTYYYRGCTNTIEEKTQPTWYNTGYCLRAEEAMRENGAKMYNFQKEDRLDRIDFQDTYIDLYNIYHDEENIDKEVTQANCESTNNSIWSSINGVGVNLCRENLNSIVTKVTDKKTGETTLLLADAETPIQNDIIDEVGQADTIKAAHHGDATGFSKEFLDSVNPSVIVTTHYDNEYSASPELLDYATSHNIPVYNTGPNWYHSSLVSNYNNGKASIVPSSESWTMVNGNWQYLDTNGTPTTGWFQDPSSFNWYYLDENGDMVTGWQELTWNGKKDWYYFDEDSGIMQYDTDIDGRHLNSNGTWDGEGSTPQKSEPSKGQSSNPSSTPSSTQADDGCVATTFFGTACGKEGIFKVLSFALDIMTIGIGILAVIGILVVGVQYLTAGDNVGQTEKAKRRMLEIIIGLVIYIVVYGLLKWLLPGFEDSLKEIAQHTFNLIA